MGNFVVYLNGNPVLIDVGVENYTAKTFSSKRYEIWTMQSAFHNLPTINGVMQAAGRQYEARDVGFHADDASAEFSADLAAAYPKEAGVEKWRRSVRLDRAANAMLVTDRFALRAVRKNRDEPDDALYRARGRRTRGDPVRAACWEVRACELRWRLRRRRYSAWRRSPSATAGCAGLGQSVVPHRGCVAEPSGYGRAEIRDYAGLKQRRSMPRRTRCGPT